MSFRSIGASIARAVAEQIEAEPLLASAWMGELLLQQPRFMRAVSESAADIVRDGMGPDSVATCHFCGAGPIDAAHIAACPDHPLSEALARVASLERALAATERAKSENDERFMAERDAARDRVTVLEAAVADATRWLDRVGGQDIVPGSVGILRKLREATSR